MSKIYEEIEKELAEIDKINAEKKLKVAEKLANQTLEEFKMENARNNQMKGKKLFMSELKKSKKGNK